MSLHNITLTINVHEGEPLEEGYLRRVAKSTSELMDQNHGHNIDVLRWEVVPVISIGGVG